MSALGSTMRGVAASAPGTLAMDASLYRGYRHDGGDADFGSWESSEGLVSWEDAPGPALVAKRLLEGVLKHEISPRYARFLNNATHWGSASPRAPNPASSSARGAGRRSGTDSRSAPRSGPADTSFCLCSASTSRSGSTTSRRSRRT
jgi:hypothetical protein